MTVDVSDGVSSSTGSESGKHARAIYSFTATRWWALATVVAAQFMFVVDAFIVNVALPSVAVDLNASGAQIEAVIVVYLVAFAALVVTGGRLGDIYGVKNVFLLGIAGFTLTSLWCALANGPTELIFARLAQGITAAMMVPQVLATIHVLFPDAARARAFAIYGGVLGLGGAVGFVLGGALVSLDLAGLGWRSVFLVNIPVGTAIFAGAVWLMPAGRSYHGVQLDLLGAVLLFSGVSCLIGAVLVGPQFHWNKWVWLSMLGGTSVLAGFVKLEHFVVGKGGLPLIDLRLTLRRQFMVGLAVAFFSLFANLSFYLVITLFMQTGLGFGALASGLAVLPLALAFVLAAKKAATRTALRGIAIVTDGCWLQLFGLGGLAILLAFLERPSPWLLALPMIVFGYGQGFIFSTLSGFVLSTVPKSDAGSASGVYGTVVQVANASGVAVIGTAFFEFQKDYSSRMALGLSCGMIAISIAICLVLVAIMRRSASK